MTTDVLGGDGAAVGIVSQKHPRAGALALVGSHPVVGWLAVVAFLALGIGLRSPWPADEPRFALISMEMVETGEWLVPHRGGEIYAEKPPLFLWTQALLYTLIGDMRVAFLLPSLLAALLTGWLVFDLSRRAFGDASAWAALLLLVATAQFAMEAKSARIDAFVCSLITLGIYGLSRYFFLDGPLRWYAAAWIAMGLGIITKGVGFLPLFMVPGLLIALGRRRRRLPRPARAATLLTPLLLLLPIAAWLVPLLARAYSSRDPELLAYVHELFFRQTLTRYVDGVGHFNPPWYFLLRIPVFWFPLSLVLPWVIPRWRRALRQGDPLHWSLLGYVVLGLLFFSLSPGKRAVYMLPLLPPLAILAGPHLASVVQLRRFRHSIAAIVLAVGAGCTALGLITWTGSGPLAAELLRQQASPAAAGALVGGVGLLWMVAAVLWRGLDAYLVAFAATWLLLATIGYSFLDPLRSASSLMSAVEERLDRRAELAIVAFREQQLLQADRPVTHWGYSAPRDLATRHAAHWLRASRSRRLLLPRRDSRLCFDPSRGESLGTRHRSEWLLLAGDAIDPAKGCLEGDNELPRYESTAVPFRSANAR